MKRIGIVGLGLKNPYTYTPILRSMGASVVAVYDDYESLSNAFAHDTGASLVTDIDRYPMDLDGVIVTSINSKHIEYAERFLDKGIPCLIEKPLSNSSDDALSFVREYHDAPWFSASPLRFSPLYKKMADDISSSSEKINYIRVQVCHTMGAFLSNPEKRWHDDYALGGGMLIDIGIHAIELINMMKKEEIREFRYLKSRSNYKDCISSDNHHIIAVYADDSMASLDLLCATNHLDYSVEAYSNTHRYLNTDENRYIEGDYTAENAYGGFIGTMEAFLAMIETGKTPVEREETIRNFSLIEKIMEG